MEQVRRLRRPLPASRPLTLNTFEALGIPSRRTRDDVLPALAQKTLGIKTVSQLEFYCQDHLRRKELLSGLEGKLPIVYIEVIIENFKITRKRRFKELIIIAILIAFVFVFLGNLNFLSMSKLNLNIPNRARDANSIAGFDYRDHFQSVVTKSMKHRSRCSGIDIETERYNQLPSSEEGFLIMKHTFGQLNNKLQEMTNLLFLAHELNRTLIVEKELGRVYDYHKWQAIFPHVNYRVATAVTRELSAYYDAEGHVLTPRENKLLLTRGGRMKLKTLFNKNRFLSVNAEFIFYFPASDPAFLRAFFSNLWPKREVIEKVNKFLEEKFGDKPFAAVHLRHLENSCPQRMRRVKYKGYTCSPNQKTTKKIFDQLLPGKGELPWFVASDHQNAYSTNSYKPNGYFFKGYCLMRNHECALIDFEICTRANFFIGVFASSASRTMALMREFRQVRSSGIFYPSVLHWDENNTWNDYNRSWWFET